MANRVDPWLISASSPAMLAMTASGGKWCPTRHLTLINRYLMDLFAREIDRLIVSATVRHGKSTLMSHYAPAWYLGSFKEHNVLITGYGDDFAKIWSEKTKYTLLEYGHLFGVHVLKQSRKGFTLSLSNGSNMLATGLFGPVLGKGFHYIGIDDPIKNNEEADSQIQRDKLDTWIRETLLTRLEPGGVCSITMARWNEDDIVGRRLQEAAQGGKEWVHVSFPAIAEEDEPPYPYGLGRKRGEPLWPERYPLDVLKTIEIEQGIRAWNACWQQRPAPIGGGFFKREWVHIYQSAPPCVQCVRYWDLAATEKLGGRDPDYTVGVLMGVDREGRFWILDVSRFRGDPGAVEETIRSTAAADASLLGKGTLSPVRIFIEQEPGAGAKIAIRHLITKTLVGYPVTADPAGSMGETSVGKHNKVTRGDPFCSQAKAGNVNVVAGPWVKVWLDEMCVMPSGAHDDQWDATAGAFNQLNVRRPASGASAGVRMPEAANWKPPEMRKRDPMEGLRV